MVDAEESRKLQQNTQFASEKGGEKPKHWLECRHEMVPLHSLDIVTEGFYRSSSCLSLTVALVFSSGSDLGNLSSWCSCQCCLLLAELLFAWYLFVHLSVWWKWVAWRCDSSKLMQVLRRHILTYHQNGAQHWLLLSLALSTLCFPVWIVLWARQLLSNLISWMYLDRELSRLFKCPESKNILQQNCLVKPVLRIIVMRSCHEAGCFNIQLL